MKQPIAILIATGRAGSYSEKVGHAVALLAEQQGIAREVIDIRDFADPFTGRVKDGNTTAVRWVQKLAEVGNIVIVAPEYNHSYPGELKVLLDRAFDEYAGRSVGIVSVSNGSFGGARMVEHLLPTLTYLKFVYAGAVHIPRVESAVEEGDVMRDEKKRTEIVALLKKM